jgi:hypothetical protein
MERRLANVRFFDHTGRALNLAELRRLAEEESEDANGPERGGQTTTKAERMRRTTARLCASSRPSPLRDFNRSFIGPSVGLAEKI